jgi:hypothetical protein
MVRNLNNLPPSTLIWRYFSLEKFYSLIIDKELYFCNLKRLEDKYEGNCPDEFRFLYEFTTIGGNSKKYQSNRENIEHKRKEKEALSTTAKTTLVCCWSKNASESYALWKIYTGNNGIAVQTTIESLKSSILDDSLKIFISPIYYEKQQGAKFELNTLVTRKTKFYKFDEEVRLFITENDAVELKVKVDLEKLITKLYFSPFMSSEMKTIVVEWLKINFPSFSSKLLESKILIRE